MSYFLAAWLTVVLWQGLGGGPASPGLDEQGGFALAVIAASAAGLGGTLQRLRVKQA